MLAQNKELKLLKKEAEQRNIEDSKEKEIENAEVEARAVEEFERVQAGLSARVSSDARGTEKIIRRRDGKAKFE